MKKKAIKGLLTLGLLFSVYALNANESLGSVCLTSPDNSKNDGHCIPHPQGGGDYCECGYQLETACYATRYS